MKNLSVDNTIQKSFLQLMQTKNFSLSSGWLGLSLFCLDYYRESQNNTHLIFLKKSLQQAIGLEEKEKVFIPSLFEGSVGLIWLMAIIKKAKLPIELDIDEILNQKIIEFEKILPKYLALKSRPELCSGVSGFLIVGLTLKNQSIINLCLNYFKEQTSSHHYKLLFPTRSEEIFLKSHEVFEGINTGVAHGQAGVILALSYVYQFSPDDELAKLISELCQELLIIDESKKTQFFPSFYPSTIEPRHNSWCYGDVGIGFSLYQAAQTLKDEDLLKSAQTIMSRGLNNQKVHSNILCHGQAINIIMGKKCRLSFSHDNHTLNQQASAKQNISSLMNGYLGEILAMLKLETNKHYAWEILMGIRSPL